MQPLKMFHPSSKYNALCKIQTRCDLATFLTMVEEPEFEPELEWFKSHPQFKHLFHMEREANRKLQGLFMLLIRTVHLDQKKNLWFVVNGIPIRYSLREHGLISGLYCHEYSGTVHPKMRLHAYTCKFKHRQFKKTSVSVKDVKAKLLLMKMKKRSSSRLDPDRLSMMILYFLSAVLAKKSGVDSAIDPFFFRMAEDPDLCLSFPWGRMTFDDSVRDVYYLMGKMEKMTGSDGKEEQLTLPGFVIPLEVFPFEVIPNLRRSFRVDIEGPDEDCPRMCKRKFQTCNLKGWPVEEIYKSLGSTKDIDSILEPEGEERALCARIFDDDLGYDALDMLPDSWSQHLQDNKKICWEKMYVEDVDSRKPKETEQEEEETVEPESAHGIVQLLKEMEKRLTANMKEGFDKVKSEIDGLEKKVSGLGEKVKDIEDEVWRGGSRESGWDFNFPSERDERVEVTGDKGKEKEGEKEGQKEGEKGEKAEKLGEEGDKEEEEGEKGEEEEEKGEEGEKCEVTYPIVTEIDTEEETEEETTALTLFTGEVTYPPVITELEASEEDAKPKKKQKTAVREKKPSQFKKPPYTADGKRRTKRNATAKEDDGAVKVVGTKRKNTGDGARKSPRKKTKN